MEQLRTVKVTITFQDSELDDVALQEATENLYQQISEVDGVEQADLIAVENPPEGSRAVGGFLLGMLTAEVSPASIKALLGFLSDRLSGKTVEMQVEAPDGRKLSIKASSQAEFEFAMKQAKDFFEVA
jgi:hypothetical protein